ncbi:MAG: pknA [Phycisphaerales bacterium]|jgi:serine/threonine protein kinase|nr:pknA [Phycisphaerales bacterium]MDB5301694.1 pknA [Phycisphaerales bacterium]MDB5304047.1 pknA [Phycisphaerales bacterium]
MAEKLLQYEVIERLGEGAGSVIYAVRDPATRRLYALKHVVRDSDKDIRFVEQMRTEFEMARLFNAPNLRRGFDLKISKSLLMKVTEAFLLMELVEGKPLDVRPPKALIDIVDTFIQAATGLRAMHQLGYVHCDIKPNNILRNDQGEVKVIDYGQSAKVGTVKERIQGTPDYIAPEQVTRRPIVPQTDVYNLGATLYWALTGRTIPTLYTVQKKGEHSFLVDARIETPAQLNPLVPIALSNLVMESVASRIDKRPPDMESVITRLELAKHVLLKQAHAALVQSEADAATPQPEPHPEPGQSAV